MPVLIWSGFVIFSLVTILLGPVILHRKPRKISPREAVVRALFWIGLALVFSSLVYFLGGYLPIPNSAAQALVASILAVGLIASLWIPARRSGNPAPPVVNNVEALAGTAYRHARRVAIFVVGSSVVLAGLVMAFLPGLPAIVVVPVGLAILGIEFAWARRWLHRIGKTVRNVQEQLTKPRSDR